MRGLVAFDIDACQQLASDLHRAAGEFEDLSLLVSRSLEAAELEDPAPRELLELGAWCDELGRHLAVRLDRVMELDASPLLGFLAWVRGGVAHAWLPGGDLPGHLQGRWPSSAEEWRELAFARAGIDPDRWRPQGGFAANRDTVAAVYDYYLDLYQRDHRLQWAAMGRLAGAPVWAGLEDLTLVDQMPGVYAAQAPWMERELLQMQRAIFEDLAWQHEAFLAGGVEAMRAAHDRGDIDDRTLLAWQHLDAGRLAQGTRLLVYREQNDVLQEDHYARWPDHAPHLAAVTSVMAASPIPDGEGFHDIVPPRIDSVSDATRSPLTPLAPVRSPLPADVHVPQLHDWDGARRTWIDEDMLEAFERFAASDDRDTVLRTPVDVRAQEFRNVLSVTAQRTMRDPLIVDLTRGLGLGGVR